MLAAGPTSAATVDDLFAPGDVLASSAVHVAGSSSYFFARDMAGTTARLWLTDGTPGGTGQTDVAFEVAGGTADPRPLLAFDDRLLFIATDSTTGRELFVTDGTSSGTRAISDFADPAANPQETVVAGGQVFFTVADADAGLELWRTDGTLAGTRSVKDINPGPGGSNPARLTAMGAQLYFAGDDGVNGAELWTSDGTESGTGLVIDLNPGDAGASPSALHVDGGRLFFAATRGDVGSELWMTDGTAGGTQLLQDIHAGASSSSPGGFVSFNGAVYFNAYEPTKGRELWRTDGTAAGTQLAVDVVPTSGADNPFGEQLAAGGKLYFTLATRQLYVTDGTAAGTRRLSASQSQITNLRPVGTGHVAFVAGDLWITDGTAVGTRALNDAAGVRPAKPTELSVLPGGALYFVASNRLDGSAPWVTDATAAGTAPLADVPAVGRPPATITRVIGAGGWIYAFGTYHSPYLGTTVPAMWSTNGRPGGGQVLTTSFGSEVLAPAADGRLYFGGGGGLQVTDGTRGGTITLPAAGLPDSFVSGRQNHVAAVGNSLYFLQRPSSSSTELWRTDGTVFGTQRVRTFTGQTAVGHAAYLAPLGDDKVFFYAYETGFGFEPWVSDGTADGTRRLNDVYPGGVSSELTSTADVTRPFSIGGQVYFFGDDGVHHNGLWVTDGTPAGTRMVKDLVPGPTSAQEYTGVLWAAIGPTVYFTAHAPQGSGAALWRTDGTDAGTVALDGPYSHWPQGLATYDGKVFFARGGGSIVPGTMDPNTLYVGDGAPGGFQPVRTFAPNSNSSSPAGLVAGPDGVYFFGHTTEHGRELWFSDGTSANTHLVFDSIPGPSYPNFGIAPYTDAVYFNANSRLHRAPPQTLGPDAPGVRSAIGAQYAFSGTGDDLTLSVSSGLVLLGAETASLYPGLNVIVADGATVTFTASQRLDRLEISGGTMKVSGDGIVVMTRELDLTPSAKLNLGTNDLAVDYDAGASPIGSWDGTAYGGITGMIARGQMFGAATDGITSLGVAEAADVLFLSDDDTAFWNGQIVDATTVLIKFTYAGDVNFDGLIDGADYGIIDNYVQFPGTTGYANGDFNYDGVIDGADYGLIDNSVQLQAAPL